VQPTDEAWIVAIHESAHAVFDLQSGAGVVELWTNGEEGRCRPRGPTSASGCLAGFVGEWHIKHPGEVPSLDDFRNQMHLADIRRAAKRLGTDDPDRLLVAWIAAKTVIDDDWDSVVRIATELRKRSRLSGDQAVRLWRGLPIDA
jgi:hypothetical protein